MPQLMATPEEVEVRHPGGVGPPIQARVVVVATGHDAALGTRFLVDAETSVGILYLFCITTLPRFEHKVEEHLFIHINILYVLLYIFCLLQPNPLLIFRIWFSLQHSREFNIR